MTRTENTARNMRFALIGQAAALLISFITRRVFISVLSQEYLGMDGLFANILSMLSLAEMGIAGAINYSLYKPLAEDNKPAIAALMRLYKKAFTGIGCTVAVLGAVLTPLLPVIIKDMPDIPNIRLIYLMFVGNSALSYLLTYKRSLIIVSQKQYVVSACHYTGFVLRNLIQIVLLLYTGNYVLFLSVMLCGTVAENLVLACFADKMYPYLREIRPPSLEPEVKSVIKKNITAIMTHKIGNVVIKGTDNLLLSGIVGLPAVALYANYSLISNGLNTIYGLLYQSFVASVGNLGTEQQPQKLQNIFDKVQLFTAWLYAFSLTSLVCLYNPFISIWVGKQYLFPMEVVIIIALNFYFMGMRNGILHFMDALGLYWHARHKPLIEAAINLIVSLYLGLRFGTAGVFLGTIIGTLSTGFWMEAYVLYKHGFCASVKPFFMKYVLHVTLAFIATAITFGICKYIEGNGIWSLFQRALVCLVVPNGIYLAVFHRSEEFLYLWRTAKGLLNKKIPDIRRRQP